MAVRRGTQAAPPPPPPPVPVYQPPVAAQALAGPEGINFGDLGFYSGGFSLPAGRYVIVDIMIQMFAGFGTTNRGPARLGAMITFVPLADPKEDNKKQIFYSFGSAADKSYAPNPVTGKGIVPIPGAPATGLNNSTNWMLFLKSFYDGGLPGGIFTNDVSVLEGTWVETALVDEPAERAGFQSATAEVSQEPRKANKIAVVHQVLDGGKPWEGSGGWPEAPVIFPDDTLAPGQPLNGGARPVPHAAPAVHTPQPLRPVAAAPAPPAIQGDAADLEMAVMSGISDILGVPANMNGVSRLLLRNGTFGAIKAKMGEPMAAQALAGIFDIPASLEGLLGRLGYKISGPMVVPVG